jgi:hypothetical protein
MEKRIPWKRFWCEIQGTVGFDDNGFMIDPEADYAHYYHTGVKTYDEISEKTCLILLGEAGIGKTYVIEEIVKNIASSISAESPFLFYFNLNEYGDENRLIADVFEAEDFKRACQDNKEILLFLDSFDECAIEIPKLATIFRKYLDRLSHYQNKMKIRIGCRTGRFPALLEQKCIGIWGQEHVSMYQLTPLREKDVHLAARELGINTINFMNAIAERKLQSLAVFPLTLLLLIKIFQNRGDLPSNKRELFEQACFYMCEEHNTDRLSAGRVGTLSPKKRLAVASRIAALKTFCNKEIISTEYCSHLEEESVLPLNDIAEGNEKINFTEFTFSEHDVREVIENTALFSGRGCARFSFIHKAIESFLAAYYLSFHPLDIKQILSLIQYAGDPEKKTVPQLKETVSWLSCFNPELLKNRMEHDPETLLEIDFLSEDVKEQIVTMMFQQSEEESLLYEGWGKHLKFRNLTYPGLGAILKAYIEDKSKKELTRMIALDMMRDCGIQELANSLVGIVLDNEESYRIRQRAALVYKEVSDCARILEFRQLLFDDLKDDANDELKGTLMSILWPEYVGITDILKAITPVKKENLLGAYTYFLLQLPEKLKTEELPVALAWVAKNPGERRTDKMQRLSDAILFRAWTLLDDDKVLDAYAEAALARMKKKLSICAVPRLSDKDISIPPLPEIIRKKLIHAIIGQMKPEEYYPGMFRITTPRIISFVDFEWIFADFEGEKVEKKRRIWVKLLYEVFEISIPAHTEKILNAREFPEIAETFNNEIAPVRRDSEEAVKKRTQYAAEKEYWEKEKQREQAEKEIIVPPPVHVRIKSALESFEKGNEDIFWVICRELTRGDSDRYYGDEINPDITGLPGWRLCDESARKRIMAAAGQFVMQRSDLRERWFCTDQIDLFSLAGYKAFMLLEPYESGFLDSLEKEIWRNWAAILIDYPEVTFDAEEIAERRKNIISRLYRAVPDDVIGLVMRKIDYEGSKDIIRILDTLDFIIDDKFSNKLLAYLESDDIPSKSYANILSHLIKRNNTKALENAQKEIEKYLSGKNHAKEKVKAAVQVLLLFSDDTEFDAALRVVSNDVDFGREIFLSMPVHHTFHKAESFAERIGEERTGKLFIVLNKMFPKAEEKAEAVGWVGSRESIAFFRDELLQYLINAGSDKAVAAIKKIIQEFPGLTYLPYCLARAKEHMRRESWKPLTPADFLLLIHNSHARIILSEKHLQEAVIESLKRLQIRLRGETPRNIFLWDNIGDGICKPKKEDYLSDYVKGFLEDDLQRAGMVAFREVEIRRLQGKGGAPGEVTDIIVSGVIDAGENKSEKIAVIIEVKGCWNAEVKTAMKNQLLDRYLKDNECNHGVYLVGWYLCEQWKNDKRKNKVPKKFTLLEDAKIFFSKQANELSIASEKLIEAFVLDCSLR